MKKISQPISFVGTGLNSDDSLELMAPGDSPTTFTTQGRQNVMVPPDNFGKLEDVWGTALVAASDRGLSEKYMGHAVDTDGKWCYYFLTGTTGSIDTNSLIGISLEDAATVRVVMEDEPELELDSDIVFKKAVYIDGWVYWASGQYGPKKIHIERAMNFTTYKDLAWDSTETCDTGDKRLYTDGGIYECLNDGVSGTPPPSDTTNWELDSYAYPNTAVSGSASLLDGAFDLVELPPTTQVTGTYSDDTSRLYNNLRGKMFQFTYRWKYRNGGYSNTAPFSELFLSPDVESYNGEIINSFVTNNTLTLYLDGGINNEWVEYIELFVRTGQELSWQYVDKIEAGTNTYSFYNDYIMEVVSDDMVNKLDNYIPRETRALELLSENVLVLGGNKYGFDNITPIVGLTVGWETATVNQAAASADVDFTIDAEVVEGVDTYYNKVIIPSIALADAGDILKINLYYSSVAVEVIHVLTDADVASETAFRSRCATLVATNSGGIVGAGWGTPPDGMTLANTADFYVYITLDSLDVASSSIGVYTAAAGGTVNKWSQFKTGAKHVFGITYFDRGMRPFAVAANEDTKIYVPTVVEAQLEGDLYSSTTYEWKNYISWEIRHEAPAEAKYWQWFYAGNANIDDFWFYAINSASATGGVLSIVITGLQEVQTTYPMSQAGPYEWQKGDRIRCITQAAATTAYGALATEQIDLEIKAFDTDTNTLTLQSTGTDTYDFGAGSLVEIYRPKTTANDDLFFAFGPIYETYVFSADVFHQGDTQDQTGITAGSGAQGQFNEGDVYFIARAMGALVDSSAVTDLFLVESKSYSDFYDSDWYSQGKINIRSNIGEVELNNLAISNKLIQDTGINGLCTFEADDIVSLPDKHGQINALRQIGNVLRVIQQRKRTSFYIGMTEFYNQDGSSNLVSSSEILGNARELDGDWGTEHPETVVQIDDMLFFWDNTNRAFVQDSENGAHPISNNKMRQFFIELGDEIMTAIYLGTEYTLACDYHSVLQTLCFYYYISGVTPKIMMYHLPSKRWVSPMSGWESTTTTKTIIYGYLYNWYAVDNASNIAASGWHVPIHTEYATLVAFLGGDSVAGGKLKETGLTYWNTPNTGADNSSMFNARGAGYRQYNTGAFGGIKASGHIWTSDGFNIAGVDYGYVLTLFNNTAAATSGSGTQITSASAIRLVKDSTTLTDGQTGTYTGNDGQVYSTICIGTQEWLSENLIETKYRDGSAIPEVTDAATWAALTTGARCSYDNDEDNAFTTTTTTTYDVGGLIGAENRFFIVENGDLYLMDSTADRREFIGKTTKESAFITVVGNAEVLIPKIIDTVGVISNQHTGWAVDNVTIPADATTKVDQVSLVIDEDWLTREGITRAPVKRNLYTTGVYNYGKLWEGEKMRGRVVKVTFTLPEQTSGKVEVVAVEIGMTSS